MNSDYLFDMLEAIAMVSSKKAKKNMLIPELQQVLEYAYDPFKTYGVRTSRWTGRSDGAVFNDRVWNILNYLILRKLTGKKAQAYVDSVCYNLTPKSSALFKRILNKDLRCGISVKSINEVFAGLVAESITMQPVEYKSRYAKFPLLVSVKLRGCRGYYNYKHNTLYSRNGKPYFGLDHITKVLRPLQHDFDGELLVPNIPFETGAGLVRNKKLTPQVCFCVFDAPNERRFIERFNYYTTTLKPLPKFIVRVDYIPAYCENELFGIRDDALEVGYEGICTVDPGSYYEPGYSTTRLKLKEEAEPIDLEVIDIYEGEGKYKGQLGGAICDYNGVEVRVGGGWSDVERIKYFHMPSLIIGKTLLVKYQETTKDNSLRNPIKLEVRKDK